jgi:phosphoenolpyruvate-protein phosphotransferase (PTS system enzyme I)
MRGIAASPGIAIGKVLVKEEQIIDIRKKYVDNHLDEIKRLEDALDEGIKQMRELYDRALCSMGEKEAQIFEAHIMILEDEEFLSQVKSMITDEKVNAEWAVNKVIEGYVHIFGEMQNEYMSERAADIKDVGNRITKLLLGIETTDFSKLEEKVIIVAIELAPSDTAKLDREKVLGFLTETGGSTSHSALMARTMEIPAVVGIRDLTNRVKSGDIVAYDGDEGVIFVNPEPEIIKKYKDKREDYLSFKEKMKSMIGEESITKDGFKVEIAANIGTPEDISAVLSNDADGIGLFRSEFLFMGRNELPTEEEQFLAYKKVAERMEGKPVVIRTLDIGGDKDVPCLKLPAEMNPFLGFRAIRLCLDRRDIFKTQLRAILKSSNYGNIKLMFPMISSLEELRQAKAILDSSKQELKKEGIKFNENIETGIMIEIPAAAVIADLFAREVDFFSLGTNDLIQYTTAVDRMNQKVSYLYNQFHPALLRLIKHTIDSGHKEGIWVGMCGEAAGDPRLIPILIGMGLDEFSMSSASVLKARWIISRTSRHKMEKLVNEIINIPTAAEVEKYLNENIVLE